MSNKTLRTAFIRVSAENHTKDGEIVKYSFSDIQELLLNWRQSAYFTYYAIEHNGEPGDENCHFHIVLKFPTAYKFETIKNKFPYGDIESARNIKRCVQYLVHLNDLSKQAYNWSDVFTNDAEIDKYKVLSDSTVDVMIKRYVDEILAGEIREYNFTDRIDPQVYVRRKQYLLNALDLYRMKVFSDKHRQINVFVLDGDTSTGKTTYAKAYCEKQSLSYCISSGTNDPWQDYKGEDVLILDELRDTTFSLDDLLKILDNHTKSSSRSRYANKLFLGKTIIITTNQDWNDWYLQDDLESRNALKRRVTKYYQFHHSEQGALISKVQSYKWNIDLNKYEYETTGTFDIKPYIKKEDILDNADLLLNF